MALLSSMARWFGGSWGGFRGTGVSGITLPASTDAGWTVDADSALAIAVAQRCIRLQTESVACLPAILYRRSANGGREVARDHPLYTLFHDSPSADCTAFEFWEAIAQGLCMWGNAYALIGRIGSRVVSLTPIRPDTVEPFRRERGGPVFFRVTWEDGTREELPRDRIWHVKGWGGGYSLTGASPIALGRHGLGLAAMTERAASKFVARGTRPTGVWTVPQWLRDPERKRMHEIIEGFAGAEAAGRAPLLEGGLEFKPLTLPPADAQLLETRKFSVEEVCRIFGVPPYLVFHTEKSTSWGTGLEQQQLGFLIFSLLPYLERIEQSALKWLVPAEERAIYYPEFAVEGLLRADSNARSEFYQRLLQTGVFTPNEVRARENIGGPLAGGERGYVNGSMVPMEQAGQQQQQQQQRAAIVPAIERDTRP